MTGKTAGKIGLATATSLVISNMVGSGIYTSLGFQLQHIHSFFAIVMLWVVGGIAAVCGSLVYGELGAAYSENGGEYHYLTKLYGPYPGFIAGWISVIAGFAAPVAAVSLALGNYFHLLFPGVHPVHAGIGILLIITLLHAWNIKLGSGFQRLATFLNVGILLFLVVTAFRLPHPQPVSFSPEMNDWKSVFLNPYFAANLYWVSYAYTGWNAAGYIGGEMSNPKKHLPWALAGGASMVTLLYVLVNISFLKAAPVSALSGQLEVAAVAAKYLLGPAGSLWMTAMITVSLLGTMSAMTFAGPRVTARMAADLKPGSWLSGRNWGNAPAAAVFVQTAIAVILIATRQFQWVIDVIGFTLTICTSLTVGGIFLLRKRQPADGKGFKTPGYPFTPILFLMINGWILSYGIWLKWEATVGGLVIIISGTLFWKWMNHGKVQEK